MKKAKTITTDIAKISSLTVILGYGGTYICQQLAISIASVL